ncbi:zinc finger MYND domain-containing protein [archaeon]|nr:MAG: zinc finger MYND domain-containing protein [archaeon]
MLIVCLCVYVFVYVFCRFVYSRVYGQHSAQWRSVLDKLASTLLACQTYLGLQACEQLLLCALRTVHIESEGESASVHALLEHMPPAVQMQVQRGLGEIFLASMQTLRDKVTLDPTLYASTLVLLINIAAVSPLLPATLLAHAALVKSALAHVHRVDLEHSLRCMHIQKTRYTGPPRSGHASSHSADSSYFTLPMMWCGDKEGRRLVRTLTSSLYARSHFFRVFLDDLRTRFDAFAARYSRAGANTSAEVKQFMLEVSQLASCTLVLRSMAFGGRTYELVEERSSSASASIKPSVCAVCSQERSVLRCSRCKAVCYCCAAHQQQHWKEHKGVCREPAACVAAVAAQSVICDTVDPDSILRHNGVTHIACLSSNSVRDIQRLYGVYADILEELRQLQDICPSKELRPYLKLLLCLLCECTGDVAYLYYHDVLQSDSQSKEARVQVRDCCLLKYSM